MNTGLKWIGGGTLAVLCLLAGALMLGDTLEAQAPDTDRWLAADDVLARDAESAELAVPRPASQNAEAADVGEADSGQATLQQAAGTVPPPVNQPLVIKRILPIEGALRYGDWHWDDDGVPEGPLVVTVDLQARVISVFRGGYEIGAAAALLGTPQHPTPVGTFPIMSKERHNVSEKYGNAPMPWTLRLTHDGVAIHGGAQVEVGYASHGCIGVPDEFASRLFAIASKGDRVIITDGVTAGLGTSLAS